MLRRSGFSTAALAGLSLLQIEHVFEYTARLGVREVDAAPTMNDVTSQAASDTRLRGLVVDWGGVLTPSLDGAMASWARQDAVEYEHFRAVMQSWVQRPATVGGPAEGIAGDPAPVADLEQADDAGPAGASPVHRLERGEMSGADFEQQLATELARRGSTVSADGLLTRMLSGLNSLDENMIGLVRQARARGIRTALLSNSWGDHYPAELWDGLFDVAVISGEVGMRKPEPQIFRHTCDRLDLAPGECVMVDDLPHNITGAAAVGMVAVQHRSYAETVAELEVLFDVSLR
jgi:putative hydrolase of the HAD superfamily